MKYFFTSIVIVCALFSVLGTPTAIAQTGIAQLSGCTGVDCSACHVVHLANGAIKWLIGILFVIFALLLAIAGVRLVTSGGNHHALDEAKSSFMNAIIGFLIILSAWLIVDTIMRALVGTESRPGQLVSQGSASGYLFWSEVSCQKQVVPNNVKVVQEKVVYLDLDPAAIEGGGIANGGGYLGGNAGGGSAPGGGTGSTGSGGGQASGGTPLTLSLRSGGTAVVAPCGAGAADRRTINFLGGSVTVHKNLVPSLQRINMRWLQMGGQNFYRVTSVAAYNCRNVAGTSRLSVHAYGLAIDINPAQNPYGSTLITNMPATFVNFFRNEGWGWGGNWSSKKDAMHFSKSRGEQGNMVGE